MQARPGLEWIRYCHPMQDNVMRILDKTLSDKVAKTTTEYAERAVEQNVWSETGERR